MKLDFFNRLTESKEHREQREKCYKSFLEFKRLFEEKKVNKLYLEMRIEYEGIVRFSYFVVKYSKDLFDFDECNLCQVKIYKLTDFPDSLNFAYMSKTITFEDLMTRYRIVLEDEMIELMKKHQKDADDRMKELIETILIGKEYHNIYEAPGNPNFLMVVNEICKVNGKYYMSITYSDLYHEKVEKQTSIPLDQYIFARYILGNGVEIIKSKENENTK